MTENGWVGKDGHYRLIGKAESTMLGWEDHGMFTGMVGLDFGGTGQGFGLMILSTHDPDPKVDRQRGTRAGLEWVMGAVKAFGVEKWEDIKGRPIIAVYEDEQHYWGSQPIGLEPLPTEGGKTFWVAEWQKDSEEEFEVARRHHEEAKVERANARK